MSRLLLRRAVQAVFVLWAASTVAFLITHVLPGDPVLAMLAGPTSDASTVDPAQAAALRADYGLDRPLWSQYLSSFVRALHGDLGSSFRTGAPVTAMLAESAPHTLLLMVSALTLAIPTAIALAWLATYPNPRLVRQSTRSVSALTVAVPTFWSGLVLAQLFSFRLRLLPAIGGAGPASLVLPAVTLSLPVAGQLAQALATGTGSELSAPYLDTARASGASRSMVHRHAMRNALVPPVSLAGLIAGTLFTGAIVVETVFASDGMGRIVVEAIIGRDFPVVRGVVVLTAIGYVVANLLADIACALLDPRLSRSGG